MKKDDDSTTTYFIDFYRESSGNDKWGCIKPLAVLARGDNLVSLLAPATQCWMDPTPSTCVLSNTFYHRIYQAIRSLFWALSHFFQPSYKPLSKSKSWNYCEGTGRTPPKKTVSVQEIPLLCTFQYCWSLLSPFLLKKNVVKPWKTWHLSTSDIDPKVVPFWSFRVDLFGVTMSSQPLRVASPGLSVPVPWQMIGGSPEWCGYGLDVWL